MDTARRKTILMIDNEPLMIDRRIIHEATSLVDAGYRVALITKGDGNKPSLEMHRGMEIHRVEEYAAHNANASDSALQVSTWIHHPSNPQKERDIRKRYSRLPWKLQTALYVLSWPPMLASILRARVPLLKRLLRSTFEPTIYLLLLRPRFITPYFRARKQRKLDDKKYRGIVSGLSPWNLQVAKLAIDKISPDVIHAHDLPNLKVGVAIARKLSVPLVYDAHELYPMQLFSNEATRREMAELERSLIDQVDRVISVNQQCSDVLVQSYTCVKQVTVLSNALESPSGFDPHKRERRWHERFKLAEDVQIMVFQGGINPVRNVDFLINALVDVPDHIHVGFITYKKDVPYYEELTKELGVFHRVHYVLEIPWEEVIFWLASADVGVMPYQAVSYNAKISSPNKLFEFVVAGLPIMASSELVNVDDAVRTHKLGVCKLLKENQDYMDMIQEMFDPTLGGPERFRKNVLAARNHFTWENEAPRLLSMYEELLRTA